MTFIRLCALFFTFLCVWMIESDSSFASDLKVLRNDLEQKSVHGDLCATYNLGTLYLHHPELNHNAIRDAYSLYEKVAEKGFSQAQENLCDMYFYGVGGSRDLKRAMKWCHSASLDQNVTDDPKAEEKRAGATWKADLLASDTPDLKTYINQSNVEYRGKAVIVPEQVGGLMVDITLLTCKDYWNTK